MCGFAMFLPLQVIVQSDLGRLFEIPKNEMAHDKLGSCLPCASTTIHTGPHGHVLPSQDGAPRL